jgi:hypothetical protein
MMTEEHLYSLHFVKATEACASTPRYKSIVFPPGTSTFSYTSLSLSLTTIILPCCYLAFCFVLQQVQRQVEVT